MGEYMKRSEYISREAALTEACHGCNADFPCEPCEPQDCEIKARLEAIPAADAIEEMSRQRDRAYARLCEWCGVCPEEKRNPEDCEIAALNPEPPEEEA